MKTKSAAYCLAVLLMIFSTSCGSVTEEIYLNEDGSGTYTMYTDMIGGTRQMMMDMMKGFYPDLDEDSLSQLVEENIWKDFPDEVDSIIDFQQELPDSLREDPEVMGIIQATNMFMKGSRKEGFMNLGATFRFKTLDELESFHELMSENQAAAPNGGGQSLELPKTKVAYSFDGKSFSRTSILSHGSESPDDSTAAVMRMMFGSSKTRTIIHLPRVAKKASKEQLLSKDGREVIYEYSLVESAMGNQSTDFKIEMK